MAGRVRVFLNTKSGRGNCALEVVELFERLGCECRISEVKPGLNVDRLHAEDAPDVAFVAAGGDGTVHTVAQALAGSGRAMGVLPVGTLNHFAKDLNLPQDLKTAAEVIALGETRRVDVAEVAGRVFVNNSSLGAYPAMVVDRERLKHRGWNKWISLAVASVRAFVRFRHLRVSVLVEGECRFCRTPFLFVGNNEYSMAGTSAGSRTSLDQGMLSLYLARNVSRLGLLRGGIAALLGRLENVEEFEHLTVTDFTVETGHRRKLRVALDGELTRLSPPLRYRILPAALRVLAPQAKPAAEVEAAEPQTAEAAL